MGRPQETARAQAQDFGLTDIVCLMADRAIKDAPLRIIFGPYYRHLYRPVGNVWAVHGWKVGRRQRSTAERAHQWNSPAA